jgi:heavy metal translocating P-type ATPase
MLHLVVLGGGVLGAALLHAGKKLYQDHHAKKISLKKNEKLPVSLSPAALETVEISPEKKEANHYFKISALGTGLAFIGEFIYAPLLIPAVSIIMYSCVPVFRNAYESIKNKKLKASVIDSIAIVGALSTRYYFASALAGFVYFAAQKLLLETEDQSKKQLSNIFGEQPRFVWVVKNGIEIETPFIELKVGDVIAIHAGELIPIDGRIVRGHASVDQHMMTGEAQPVEKKTGDSVLAGTFTVSGEMLIEVEKCGEETVAAKIGEILQNTADFRFSVEAKSVQLSDKMVLPTLAVSGVGLLALGPVSGVALVSCNFSEVIRVVAPIGVLNFIKLATEQGMLIKDGRSLELLNDVDTVVFDKTGTLTIEQPHVKTLHVWGMYSEEELLIFAAAAEYKQTHPIAKAILKAAQERELMLPRIENAKYEVGYGIKVELDDKVIDVGSYRFMMMQLVACPIEAEALQNHSHENGFSVIYVAINQVLIGAVELHATVRPEAKAVIEQLQARGLDIYIISGDHEKPTSHLAHSLGINNYFAETLPENKAELIGQLQAKGKSICFIGDGINDAIALKKANVSISLQGASTAAIDTAGIILMDKNLTQLPYLFELANGLNKNVRNSFASALVPGAIGVGGVFLLHFGIYSSLVLYITSLVTGTANAMSPLLTYRDKGKMKK